MRAFPNLFLFLLLFGLAPVMGRGQAAPVPADPTQVKADLKRILEAPEFQPDKRQEGLMPRFSHWLNARWDAFVTWLRKLFHLQDRRQEAEQGARGDNFLATLVVPLVTALLLVPVIWLIILLILAVARNWKGAVAPKVKSTTTFDIDEAAADMMEEPDEWLRQAQHFAEAGDFRRAFRAVFLGVLLQLDKAGAIEYNRYRTNGDYVRLLRTRGLNALVEAFWPLVFEFDLRWYGNRATAEEDYRRCRREYDRIRQLLVASASTAALPTAGRA